MKYKIIDINIMKTKEFYHENGQLEYTAVIDKNGNKMYKIGDEFWCNGQKYCTWEVDKDGNGSHKIGDEFWDNGQKLYTWEVGKDGNGSHRIGKQYTYYGKELCTRKVDKDDNFSNIISIILCKNTKYISTIIIYILIAFLLTYINNVWTYQSFNFSKWNLNVTFYLNSIFLFLSYILIILNIIRLIISYKTYKKKKQ